MGSTTSVQISLFRADWSNGFLISEICQRHTLTKDQVVRLRVGLELPPRLDRAARLRRHTPPPPTPDQIKERAAAIREGWDEDTERRRRGAIERPYEIPWGVETPPDFDPSWYE
jgi:hypothetical protein